MCLPLGGQLGFGQTVQLKRSSVVFGSKRTAELPLPRVAGQEVGRDTATQIVRAAIRVADEARRECWHVEFETQI
ncbi:hypothetical protein D3C71_2035890 [compost metagenome]